MENKYLLTFCYLNKEDRYVVMNRDSFDTLCKEATNDTTKN